MISFDFIKGKLRIVSLDLLNSFNLMGVSRVVGQCCCVRLGDLVFEARVCPMGFRRSCGAMPAICTSCILKTYVGDPSELTRPDVPGFIPLIDGIDGIFVIYGALHGSEGPRRDWPAALPYGLRRAPANGPEQPSGLKMCHLQTAAACLKRQATNGGPP